MDCFDCEFGKTGTCIRNNSPYYRTSTEKERICALARDRLTEEQALNCCKNCCNRLLKTYFQNGRKENSPKYFCKVYGGKDLVNERVGCEFFNSIYTGGINQ